MRDEDGKLRRLRKLFYISKVLLRRQHGRLPPTTRAVPQPCLSRAAGVPHAAELLRCLQPTNILEASAAQDFKTQEEKHNKQRHKSPLMRHVPGCRGRNLSTSRNVIQTRARAEPRAAAMQRGPRDCFITLSGDTRRGGRERRLAGLKNRRFGKSKAMRKKRS